MRRPTLSIQDLLAGEIIDASCMWLSERRKSYPDFADVWRFRRNRSREIERLRRELATGTFRFQLLSRVRLADGEEIDLWSARDALVLKLLALTLTRHLPHSSRCFHLKTEGEEKKGAKAAVRSLLSKIQKYPFVLKTDVKSYYASISHYLLIESLAAYIHDPLILNLIYQYLKRCAERGGLFWEFSRGISLGCPLSPVIGTFFLYRLDVALERRGLCYIRFMDDIVALAPTRWKLRQAVRVVNQTLGSLQLEKHPDKTYIGRVEKGFDFLGYRLTPEGIEVATPTLERFLECVIQLYEQQPEEAHSDSSQLEECVRRWMRWRQAGF